MGENLNGLQKNLQKMKEAKRRLELNNAMIDARYRLRNSKLLSMGKDNYFHCLINVHTEEARAEPYYYVHRILYYRTIPAVLLALGFFVGFVSA